MVAEEELKYPLTKHFVDALGYAHEIHRKQSRKGTQIPYLAHLLSVAALVLENDGSEDEAIAALLHDALEDGEGTTLEEIADRFCANVADIVRGCSEDYVPGGRGPETWRKRKKNYIASLEHEERPKILRVSLADKVHNARAILSDYRVYREKLWDRFNASGPDELWYYRKLADTFTNRMPDSRLVGEFVRIVTELEDLAKEDDRSAGPA